MTFTEDQNNALAGMVKWYNTPPKTDHDYFCTLDGAAGTGKTTISKEFIRLIGILPSKITVSAPTHKAKKVIGRSTGLKAETIQKLLGLRPNTELENFDINRPQFDPKGEPSIRYIELLVLDEGSMVNKHAFDLILKYCKKWKVRVLFMGDRYQLPPIEEDISKVFSHVKHKFTLTTVVRQGDNNPMTPILVQLRKDIDDGTAYGLEMLTTAKAHVINGKGFRCLSESPNPKWDGTFLDAMLELYHSSEHEVDTDFMKYLAFTNNSVESWSEQIRRHVLGVDSDKLLNPGENLLGYSHIVDYRSKRVILGNSENYSVVLVESGKSSQGIKGFHVTIENEEGFRSEVFIVDHTDITHYRNACKQKLKLAKQNKGAYWGYFYRFKEAHLLMVNVYKTADCPRIGKNLLIGRDLYYNYGNTTHKSQGSSYGNAAVNLVDIWKIQDISMRARLIYVAMSRTKNINLILVEADE